MAHSHIMTDRRAPQDQDKYVVRFPEGMRDRLKAAAGENNRSLNQEIIARLDQSFGIPGVFDRLAADQFAAASTYKRAEVERDIAEVLEKHFPSPPLEMSPEQMWELSEHLLEFAPDEELPRLRSEMLAVCRQLAKDPNWKPPVPEDSYEDMLAAMVPPPAKVPD